MGETQVDLKTGDQHEKNSCVCVKVMLLMSMCFGNGDDEKVNRKKCEAEEDNVFSPLFIF